MLCDCYSAFPCRSSGLRLGKELQSLYRKLALRLIIVTKNVTGLSTEESSFLATLAGQGRTIFTTADAHEIWQEPNSARVRLHELEKKGWIERLQRGRYLIIPLEAGPEREWSENPFVIASHIEDQGAIAYWTALHHWGFTEQVPRVTFVQTTRRKKERVILGTLYRFITITPKKFFGFKREFSAHHAYRITDPEKTVLDCLDRPDLAGGIPEVIKALGDHHKLAWDRVDDYLDRMQAGAVVKRLGFLVENMGLPIPDRDERLERWQQKLTQGISVLDPSSPRDPHRIQTRWGVEVNIDEALFERQSA